MNWRSSVADEQGRLEIRSRYFPIAGIPPLAAVTFLVGGNEALDGSLWPIVILALLTIAGGIRYLYFRQQVVAYFTRRQNQAEQ